MNKPYYPNLEAEISKNGMKKKDIANMLNITPRAFAEKMTGRVDFWWKEVGIIQNLFPDVPAEKLFEHTIEEWRETEKAPAGHTTGADNRLIDKAISSVFRGDTATGSRTVNIFSYGIVRWHSEAWEILVHIIDAFRDTPIGFTTINGIKVKKEKEESKHPLSVRGSELAAMCLERKLIENIIPQ